MSLWLLNPPAPAATPTESAEVGNPSSGVVCGGCQAVPAQWLLEIPEKYMATEGPTADQTRFILRRRPWKTTIPGGSDHTGECLWSSEKGWQLPAIGASSRKRFDLYWDVGGNAWRITDFGHDFIWQLFQPGALYEPDGDQVNSGLGAIQHNHFVCLGRNRFTKITAPFASDDGFFWIEPYFG